MLRWAGRFPCLDFAGGTVVHVTSGVSALVTALYLGKRIGYPKVPMPPHSVVLSFIGACLLWVGWFGFNAGSALACGDAGDVGVCGDALWRGGCGDWLERGGVDSAGQAFGAGSDLGRVAGLVAITPAAGFVTPMSALWIGLIAGVFCYLMVVKVKAWFGYDDSLDAFGVHGAGGTMGAMLTGVFANSVINPIFGAGKADGVAGGECAPVAEPDCGRGDCVEPFDCGYADDFVHRG